MAELIGTKPLQVDYWREVGLLKGIRLNEKNEYLYENPNADAIQQIKRRIKTKNQRLVLDCTYEAQYETYSLLQAA